MDVDLLYLDTDDAQSNAAAADAQHTHVRPSHSEEALLSNAEHYVEESDDGAMQMYRDHTVFTIGLAKALDTALHLVYDIETGLENHNNHVEIELALGKCYVTLDGGTRRRTTRDYVPPMLIRAPSDLPDPRKDAFTEFMPPTDGTAHFSEQTHDSSKKFNRTMPSDLFVALAQSLYRSLNANIARRDRSHHPKTNEVSGNAVNDGAYGTAEDTVNDDFMVMGESSWLLSSTVNSHWPTLPSVGKLRMSGDVGLHDEFIFHPRTIITPHLAQHLSLKTSYEESLTKLVLAPTPTSTNDANTHSNNARTNATCLHFKRHATLAQTATSPFVTSMSVSSSTPTTPSGIPMVSNDTLPSILNEARKLPSVSPLTPYLPQSLLVHNASTAHQRAQIKRKLCKTLLLASPFYNVFDMTLSVNVETAVFATTQMGLRTMPSVSTFRDYMTAKRKPNRIVAKPTAAISSSTTNAGKQIQTSPTEMAPTTNKARFNSQWIPLVIVESSTRDDTSDNDDDDGGDNPTDKPAPAAKTTGRSAKRTALRHAASAAASTAPSLVEPKHETHAVVYPPLDPDLSVTCRKTFFVAAHPRLFTSATSTIDADNLKMLRDTPMWRIDMSLHWYTPNKKSSNSRTRTTSRDTSIVDIYDVAYAYRMILDRLCTSFPDGNTARPDGSLELSNLFKKGAAVPSDAPTLDDAKLSRYVPHYEVEMELVDPIHLLRAHNFDTTATATTILQQTWALQDWLQQEMIVFGHCDYALVAGAGPHSQHTSDATSSPNYIYNISVVADKTTVIDRS